MEDVQTKFNILCDSDIVVMQDGSVKSVADVFGGDPPYLEDYLVAIPHDYKNQRETAADAIKEAIRDRQPYLIEQAEQSFKLPKIHNFFGKKRQTPG